MKVRSTTGKCTVTVSIMSSASVARQMDPPDSKQTAQSHKLLHLHWIPSITQTTLPSPPHDRLLSEQVFGFDIEPTVELHDATPPCVFSPSTQKKTSLWARWSYF